jgi:hypothetical protein
MWSRDQAATPVRFSRPSKCYTINPLLLCLFFHIHSLFLPSTLLIVIPSSRICSLSCFLYLFLLHAFSFPFLPSLLSLSSIFTNALFFLLLSYTLNLLFIFLQFGPFSSLFLSSSPNFCFISLVSSLSSPFPHSASYSTDKVGSFGSVKTVEASS